MDALKAHASAAAAIHGLRIAGEFEARMERVRRLGAWAGGLMKLGSGDADRYRDILHRLAISSLEERVIFDRVRDDLAAAGVLVSRARVREMYERDI